MSYWSFTVGSHNLTASSKSKTLLILEAQVATSVDNQPQTQHGFGCGSRTTQTLQHVASAGCSGNKGSEVTAPCPVSVRDKTRAARTMQTKSIPRLLIKSY